MPVIKVTLTASATPILPPYPPVNSAPTLNSATVQNNAAHVCAVGDSTMAALTDGILLAGGTPGSVPGGSYTIPGHVDLSKKYLFGTSGDIILVDYN